MGAGILTLWLMAGVYFTHPLPDPPRPPAPGSSGTDRAEETMSKLVKLLEIEGYGTLEELLAAVFFAFVIYFRHGR
jgi:hypothetical protein